MENLNLLAQVDTVEDVVTVLNRLVSWAYTLFLILAVLFVIYAAYLFLTAAGNPDQLKKAKNQLLYAIIAIALALVANGAVFLVEELLGVGPTPQGPIPSGLYIPSPY